MIRKYLWAAVFVLLITAVFVWLMLTYSGAPGVDGLISPVSTQARLNLQFAPGFPNIKDDAIARWKSQIATSDIAVDPAKILILARFILTPAESAALLKTSGFGGAEYIGSECIYLRSDNMVRVVTAFTSPRRASVAPRLIYSDADVLFLQAGNKQTMTAKLVR